MLRLRIGSYFPALFWTVVDIQRNGVIVVDTNVRKHTVSFRIVEELIDEGVEIVV